MMVTFLLFSKYFSLSRHQVVIECI